MRNTFFNLGWDCRLVNTEKSGKRCNTERKDMVNKLAIIFEKKCTKISKITYRVFCLKNTINNIS